MEYSGLRKYLGETEFLKIEERDRLKRMVFEALQIEEEHERQLQEDWNNYLTPEYH